MAYINIKSAVVEREFSGGKGFAVAERFETRAGEQASKPFTVWFDEPTELAVGTVADFSGLYSDKIDEYEDKEGNIRQVIRRNINSAEVKNATAPGGGGADVETPW